MKNYKNLDNLIVKALEKESRINQKITELEQEKKKLNSSISKCTSVLVEYELADDEKGKVKTKKEIAKLKESLTAISERLSAYKILIERGSLNEEEKEKIRTVYLNGKSLDEDRIRSLRKEEEEIEKQQHELNKRLEMITHEVNAMRHNKDSIGVNISKILSCIDPRAMKLDVYERNRFINNWLSGGTTDGFFEKTDEPERTSYNF